MSEEYQFLTPQEAWASLVDYRTKYYKQYGAAYSGNRRALRETGAIGSFWRRGGKTKMHVELAGDIAATSADLLFAEEPIFEIEHEQDDTLRPEAEAALLPRQARLDQLNIELNMDQKRELTLEEVNLIAGGTDSSDRKKDLIRPGKD